MKSTRTAYFDCLLWHDIILYYTILCLFNDSHYFAAIASGAEHDLSAFTNLQLSGFDIVR